MQNEIFDRSISTVFLFLYWQRLTAIFYFCIGNTIGILPDNSLVATCFCLWIPVSNAVVRMCVQSWYFCAQDDEKLWF